MQPRRTPLSVRLGWVPPPDPESYQTPHAAFGPFLGPTLSPTGRVCELTWSPPTDPVSIGHGSWDHRSSLTDRVGIDSHTSVSSRVDHKDLWGEGYGDARSRSPGAQPGILRPVGVRLEGVPSRLRVVCPLRVGYTAALPLYPHLLVYFVERGGGEGSKSWCLRHGPSPLHGKHTQKITTHCLPVVNFSNFTVNR